MLRVLRLTGIIVFAIMVGIAANTLWKMHETGELADRYNSRRKANITMMAFSMMAVGALGYFELIHLWKYTRPQGYGGVRNNDEDTEDIVDGLDSTSIYAAPKTMDAWQGRRTHSSRSRHKRSRESASIWMGLLGICCTVMPITYIVLLVLNLVKPPEAHEVVWLLPSVYGLMILFSIVSATGIMTRKRWGLTAGYLLAICNLMVFPVGTALGLFLLMGLVGASAEFMIPDREKRRAARRKAARKVSASVI